MLPLPRGVVWQLLFLFCAVLYINGVRSDGRVVCYYTNWSVYRPGTAKFNPQNINPYLCTHLIYAFGGFTKDNQMKPFDKYQDIEQGGYAKFTGLKTYNKQLKTMIAIGGWNEASSRFSPLVANPERRQKFIKNILKFLRQNHFDGIDLDWEYPAHREGGKPRDRDNYAQFVQELRAEFERESEKTGRPRLLVTMAVPAGIEYIEKGYDIPKLNKYLDWFNVLTYDFHSSHEPSVNHHAPLYSLEEESEYNYDAELNIDYSIKFYLNAGADRDKLVLGIPTYGRSFTLINEESTEIGAPAEAPGDQGDATREKGYLAYYEICQNLKEDPEWTVVQPNSNAMGPYAYRRNQWVGYDDEAIVRKKAQYVVDNGLGGIMFWAIDNDDFRGTCTGKPYPLIEAAKESMLDALGLGINEVSKPSAPQKPSRSRARENSSSTRNRITTTEHKLTYAERKGSSKRTQATQQNTRNRQQSTTTSAPTNFKLTEVEGSSLYIGGRTTTPPPPTTPDPGTDFKCEDEGFFQHPRDCKKYYWCLDSGPSGLGIVAHMFTCPSGLYFNPAADSCDFARNVPCKTKKSSTAAPITSSATTTTTTARPTSSYRVTAATSRSTTFFRTTPRTTTTTEAVEDDIEYEEEDDNVPSPFAKPKGFDKDSEEDPRVIKELIELIRKVGGIEELEKHLLRKDDGTISIKENSSSSSSSIIATTPSSISKSLYEKVLSKPNALNSFRNRFTSSSSFRTTKTQTKTQDSTQEDDEESHETDSKSSGASAGSGKYSSVLRGNSRQGPQSDGIDKLSEFDGFLKEKKQYITINRNRGTKKTSADDEEEDVSTKFSTESNEEDEEEVLVSVKSTRRPSAASTLAYSTIKRTRPFTTTETNNEDQVEEKDVTERKSYSSLNRSRLRGTTTTELPEATEVTAGSRRYKYLERTRPTRPTTESSNKVADEDDDDHESENLENTVHFKAVNIENTRETQKEITTNTQRTYASIGRRTTTSTTAPPENETETTTSAAKTSFTTATPTTSTTETPLTTPLTILETTTPESILITRNIPITTTTNPTTTTVSTTTKNTIRSEPNGEDALRSLTTTPRSIDISSDISETIELTHDIDSLLTESSTFSSLNSTTFPTTESGLDTKEQEIDSQLTTTTETTISSTKIVKNESDNLTKTDDTDQEEVNLVIKQKNKTLYNTRTRTTTTTTPPKTTTITIVDFETTPSPTTTNAKKQLGVRRQQILLNRSSQTKTTSSVTTTDIPTSTTEPVNNDFLGTVSSPRPFGFPKRRTRPTTAASIMTTTEEISKSNDETLAKKQKTSSTTTKLNAAANSQTKVSSHITIHSQTATETSSQQEHVQKNESEVTSTEQLNSKDTKVEHLKKHVVVQVDGIEGNNDNLRHVNNLVNIDNINNSEHKIRTHTIVQEVDDDQDEGTKKLYSWRDARRPTKPTPKKKKLIVTEVTTEERVRQIIGPDHLTIGNEVKDNEKHSRFNNKQNNLVKETGKYRGKSLDSSLESKSLEEKHVEGEDEGRAFKTYSTINRSRQPNKQSTGIGEDELALDNFKITQLTKSNEDSEEDLSKTNWKYSGNTRGQSKETVIKETVSGSSQESEEALKTKFKYINLNRGSTSKVTGGSESSYDEPQSNDDLTFTRFKYTKNTSGQESQIVGHEKDATNSGEIAIESDSSLKSEEGLKTKFKHIALTSGSSKTSGSEANDDDNKTNEHDENNTSFKYTNISRGQGLQTSEKENISQENESSLKTKVKYTTLTGDSTKSAASKTQFINDEGNSSEKKDSQYVGLRAESNNTKEREISGGSGNQEANKELNVKYSTLNHGSSVLSGLQSNNNESDYSQNKTTYKYTEISRGQSSQKETYEENKNSSHSEADGSITNKYKYTSLNRTHDTSDDSYNGKSDDTTQTNSTHHYTKITRENDNHEEGSKNSHGSAKTTNALDRGQISQIQIYEQDSALSETGRENKSNTTIPSNRNTESTTENTSYKAIGRISQGVHFTEGDLSGFVKHSGDSASTDATRRTISSGNQITQNESTEDRTAEHLLINAMEALSYTQIEKSTENDHKKPPITTEVKPTTTTEYSELTTTTIEAATTTTGSSITEESTTTTEEPRTENPIEYMAASTETTTFEPAVLEAKTNNQEQTASQNSTQTGRRRVLLRKRPTLGATQSSVSQEISATEQVNNDYQSKQVSEETSESTKTQTSFRRRTLVTRRPTVTEDKETNLKFERGSLVNTATEFKADDSESNTHPSLTRGNYRPQEKGDLSSLLALDLAKKNEAKSQQRFGNGKRRRPVDGPQLADTNEENSETLNGGITSNLTNKRIFKNTTSGNGLGSSLETIENAEFVGSAIKGDTETTVEESSDQKLKTSNFSLLSALNLTKKQQGNRRLEVHALTQASGDNAKNGKNRFSSAGNQQTSSVTETVNGRRRTIIRKRIQSAEISKTQSASGSQSNQFLAANHIISSEPLQNHSENILSNNSGSEGTFNHENETSGKTGIETSNELLKSSANPVVQTKTVVEHSAQNGSVASHSSEKSLAVDSQTTSNAEKQSNANENTSVSSLSTKVHDIQDEISSKFKAKQTAGSLETNTYNSINRKYTFANKGVTNKPTNKTKSETTQSVVEESEEGQNSQNNNISSASDSRFQSRNTWRSQSQENTRKSNYSGRRGSTRLKNNQQKTEEVEILDDGSKRIKTTYIETINTAGNKVKTIKRTKIKTITKQASEYEYEDEESPLTPTTRRPLLRNRGSIRFQGNDLSSLLALDLASKSNRQVYGESTSIKSRRKLIRKPDIVKEEEYVEEFEEDLPIRQTRPTTTTEAPQRLSERPRPTRQQTRTTTTAPKIAREESEKDKVEKVVSTPKRNVSFRRPSSTTQVPFITTETVQEFSTTKRAFAFKRSGSFLTTTTEFSEDDATTGKPSAFTKSPGTVETTTTTEETLKTSLTQNKSGNGRLNRYKTPTTTVEKFVTTSNKPFTTTIESTVSETTTPESTYEPFIETTTVRNLDLASQDSLDILKNQLVNAVNNFKIETEKVTETEIADALVTKNEIASSFSNGQDLSLPIYHRRKYYQYYKDSPITYVSPITVNPRTSADRNVNIAKQIHEVFNANNDHIQPASDEILELKAIEQAKEINAGLSHFLLKTPGSI